MLTKQDLAAIDGLMAARFAAMKQELKAELKTELMAELMTALLAELEVRQQFLVDTLAEMIGGLIAYMDEQFGETYRWLRSHEYRITTLEARATG